MTKEEKELTITYLTEMQEEYIEGEGYERHPLPEYYALDMAIKALEQEPSDCVSRAEVNKLYDEYRPRLATHVSEFGDKLKALPPVTPTQSTCKDCRHWKDSDGVYRRGIDAESKCPINIKEVYEGNFYCKWFEKRGGENESIN